MTRRPISDALIREALVLDAGGALPAGVLDVISVGIRRTRQDRPLLGRLGVVGGLTRSRAEPRLQDRRMTWAIVTVGAMLALVAGMLFAGGGGPGPGPLPSATTETPAASVDATPAASLVPFTPTNIARIVPVGGGELWAAGPRDGIDAPMVWHGTMSGGIWEPIGPAGGIVRSIAVLADGRPIVAIDSGRKGRDNGVWVRGDDGAWDRVIDQDWTILHVARDGTAWLALYGGEGPLLRAYRVDGGVWTELVTIDRPVGGTLLEEAPDGSIWTAGINYSGSGGVGRCTIAGCEVVLPRTAEIADLAVAPDGRVAVVIGVPNDASQGQFNQAIDELVEGSWTTIVDPAPAYFFAIEYASDGSLWRFGVDRELQRRDETGTWTTRALGSPAVESFSSGPDGVFWWYDMEAGPDGGLRQFDPGG